MLITTLGFFILLIFITFFAIEITTSILNSRVDLVLVILINSLFIALMGIVIRLWYISIFSDNCIDIFCTGV